MEKELQELLNKFDVIRQESKHSSDEFNIFSILRQESDEVNLHSRFLYELLNPKGSHGEGIKFLQLFAEICRLPTLSYGHVNVRREHANIDILIQDNQHAVVIENKIYAGDQHEQLKRYHEYAVKSYRKPTLFYLTLNGKNPTDWSIGDLKEDIKLISYTEEIDLWLTACIKEVITKPSLRETLIQYQNLIHRLTGKNVDQTEKQKVLSLMAQDNNAELSVLIARNWNHVRHHSEWNFWNELTSHVLTTRLVAAA